MQLCDESSRTGEEVRGRAESGGRGGGRSEGIEDSEGITVWVKMNG